MADAVEDLLEEPAPSGRAHVSPGPTAQRDINLDGFGNLSDEALADELVLNGATNVRIVDDDGDDDIVTRDGGLPHDLFGVSGKWATYIDRDKQYIAFYGRWNYKNQYIGSGNPYDAAALAVSNFSQNCWTNTSTGLKTFDQDGTKTNLRSRKDADHNSTIWNVNDDTRAFQLLTDMGFAWIEMRRDKLGCDDNKHGKFYHEHNQNGNGGWSASVNLAIFSISYTGEDGQALQKSSKYKTLPYNE
ncbi:MAG: hypothetical protein QM714_16575 [Nocardioides sp.]|uniref:hypothetical protein n=1 Tax=Nocardioides sp. TaxID=35761 RepID=UPI0039E674EB